MKRVCLRANLTSPEKLKLSQTKTEAPIKLPEENALYSKRTSFRCTFMYRP